MYRLSLSRRELLRRTGMGCGALALGALLDQAGLLATNIDQSKPLAPRPPHFEPQAKSVIWIMLNGGPGQMDTWDYKPELQKRDGEPLDGADTKTGFFLTSGKLMASPFQFSQHGESGTWVSEIFRNWLGTSTRWPSSTRAIPSRITHTGTVPD